MCKQKRGMRETRGANGTEQEWGAREKKDKLEDQRRIKEGSVSMVANVIAVGVEQLG